MVLEGYGLKFRLANAIVVMSQEGKQRKDMCVRSNDSLKKLLLLSSPPLITSLTKHPKMIGMM